MSSKVSKTKSTKMDSKKDSKKESTAITNSDNVDIDSDNENDGEEINGDDEMFFNKDSYNAFTKKNNIDLLDDGYYINNDLHKVEIVTPVDKRITSEIMTLAEYTRVLSERAKQIENGSVIFVDLNGETNLVKIAEMEILQKKCPMKIIRYITTNIKEIWEVNEMLIPFGSSH
jgi:DNA-directed RNA polymerase I, II, and III subunit RPABC2